MKRFTLIVALLLMVSMPMKANPVDQKTAKKVAETFMQAQTGTKATLQIIDYADRSDFSNFYVFGTENSFVIISADDCVQPVLGYSTENPFGTEKMPENLYWWLKGYDEQIADAAKSGQKATSNVAKEWKDLVSGNTSKAKSEVIVAPLVETKWNQNSPYNNLCPPNKPKLTGCVATAMAQIMKYWTYPTTGFGSHSYIPATHPEYGEQTANFGETTYEWANMIDDYSNSGTDEQKKAVATLMYHCGVSVNMNYGSSGNSSAAQSQHVVNALTTYFNYSQTAQYISRDEIVDENGQEDLVRWKNMLKDELTARRPLQYLGRRVDGNNTVGHSFICDGYEVDANNNETFHFNWGWGGDGDGSFVITGINYPLNQAAIFGIQPITYNVQPSGLTVSVSGQNVSLTWTGVNNASSYNVYRDYALIGNTGTSACTFTDNNAPIGNHAYFVRCVDGDGNVSLPSNIANANVVFSPSLENLKIEHLELSYQNGNATLQWEAPYRLQYLDYYTFEGERYYWGPGEQMDFYWGARFPASILPSGSSLTSVSTDFKTAGNYTLYIYRCTGGRPSGDPAATVMGTFKDGWNTIAITPAVTLDNQNDLWIVFKSTDILWTLNVGEQNADEGNYYSLNGTNWYHLTGYSYFISANLTDGNFTYNIYDNGNCVADNLNTSVHTLSSISSNTAHRYTVKTKLGDDETPASNMAGVTVGTASLTNLALGDDDHMTVAANSTLSVGSLTNSNPDNLIIEDGGQLTTSSENVTATVKKNIEAASHWNDANYTADGWYFIASPMVSNPLADDITGMITSDETVDENVIHTFDLYRYNESAPLEWENYWNYNSGTSPFAINNGTGYLYASKGGTMVEFRGIIKPYSAENNTVPLVQNEWNLIGNPFTCQVTVDHAFAELNNGASVTYQEEGGTINPCAGIAVYGTEEDETVTFTMVSPQSPTPSQNNLNIVLTQQVENRDGIPTSSAIIDNAIISFNEGSQLGMFNFGEKKADLYIPKDGKKYAIMSSNSQSEMPLNFKANEDSEYTLTVSTTLNSQLSTLNLNYLHLIDNLTGNDIDLLVTPSYTFEAKTSDYASRFRLVFTDENGEVAADGHDTFAYISDGQLQILNQGEALLQIVDALGRTLSSEIIQGNYGKPLDLNAGVYIVRLSNTQTTRTQKIVVQ